MAAGAQRKRESHLTVRAPRRFLEWDDLKAGAGCCAPEGCRKGMAREGEGMVNRVLEGVVADTEISMHSI